jgi:hypothetical protein
LTEVSISISKKIVHLTRAVHAAAAMAPRQQALR